MFVMFVDDIKKTPETSPFSSMMHHCLIPFLCALAIIRSENKEFGSDYISISEVKASLFFVLLSKMSRTKSLREKKEIRIGSRTLKIDRKLKSIFLFGKVFHFTVSIPCTKRKSIRFMATDY